MDRLGQVAGGEVLGRPHVQQQRVRAFAGENRRQLLRRDEQFRVRVRVASVSHDVRL